MAASPITSRFGATVRSLRHRLGISQATLAARAGLHRTYVSGIESGTRNVTLNSVDKLACALEVSVESLFSSESGHAGKEKLASGESPTGKSAAARPAGETLT